MIFDDWILLPERAAVHLPSATAVIADVHLGYATARRAAGDAVPFVDAEPAFAALARALRRHQVTRLVIAGDVFEESASTESLEPLLVALDEADITLHAVVPGNHDRRLHAVSLPIAPDGVQLGKWRVIHGDLLPTHPFLVHGHWHPAIRWRGVKRPCFLLSASRVVLPAFSSDAAGVDVRRLPEALGLRRAVIVGTSVTEMHAGRARALNTITSSMPSRRSPVGRSVPQLGLP